MTADGFAGRAGSTWTLRTAQQRFQLMIGKERRSLYYRHIGRRDNRTVGCFVDEDLPAIIKYTGEDTLLLGSDFVHHDHATELDFMGALRERVNRGEITDTFVRKLTYDNPRAFYGL
jgi:Amidohydrolase